MARLIRHDAHEPHLIKTEELEGKAVVAICACGLSQNKPYCDGSHKATADEDQGTTYRYEGDTKEGERSEV